MTDVFVLTADRLILLYLAIGVLVAASQLEHIEVSVKDALGTGPLAGPFPFALREVLSTLCASTLVALILVGWPIVIGYLGVNEPDA